MRRLSRLARLRPTGAGLVEQVARAGVPREHMVLEQDRFTLLFPSGREFLFAPSIEHGPLRLWKAIIGKAHEPQRVFWHLKEAIDTYFAGHVFAVTIASGCLRVQAPGATGEPLARRYWRRYPALDRIFHGGHANEEDDLELDIDLDEDEDEGEDEAAAAPEPEESFADVGLALGLSGAGTSGRADAATDEADDQAVFAALERAQAPQEEDDDGVVSLDDEDGVFAALEDDGPGEAARPPRAPPPPPVRSGAARPRARHGPPPPPPPRRKK